MGTHSLSSHIMEPPPEILCRHQLNARSYWFERFLIDFEWFEFQDGQNNRVKEWKKVEAVKGVFSDEIQLSSYPVLGDWTISVKSGGKETTKKFTVAEYVLPKFEVTVDVPQHATFSNSKVPVNVYAKWVQKEMTIVSHLTRF